MIILRNREFSLRERNRVKEKAQPSKESLEEINLGISYGGDKIKHNSFHQVRSKTHTKYLRDRIETE